MNLLSYRSTWGLFALALTLFQPALADSTPVENLLNFFGNTCTAKDNSYTKAALSKATTLSQILISMNNDPDCKGLSPSYLQAQGIASHLQILQETNSDQQSYIIQEQAILASIASSTDPVYTAKLEGLYQKLQSSMDMSAYTRASRAARDLVAQTQSLVDQAVRHQGCLMKKPNLLATIGALVSQAGAAATIANPAVGLGISAGGSMIAQLVNMAREFKYAHEIRKLQNDTLKPEAISCVMESLSNDYCRAADAISALDWKTSHESSTQYPPTSTEYALTMIDRDIPAFTNWLITLRAAGLSQNTADASRVVDFNDKEALYRASPWIVSGVIEEKKPSLQAVQADPNKAWPVLKDVIQNIAYRLTGNDDPRSSGHGNPLFQKYSIDDAQFYLIGFSAAELPLRTNNGQIIYFDSYNPNQEGARLPSSGPISYNLEDVLKRFKVWFEDTAEIVNINRTRILQPDAQLTLENAYRIEQDPARISPYQAITNMITFLETQKLSNGSQDEAKVLLPNTIQRLKEIQKLLNSVHIIDPATLSIGDTSEHEIFNDIIKKIYKLAELDFGILFMRDRLGSHVDSALIRYLQSNQSTISQSVLAQTLASKKMTELLLQSNADADLGAIRDDINNSITITLPSLQKFVKFFEKDIAQVLARLKELELQAGPKMGVSFKDKRAKICMLLTQNTIWPSKVPQDLCEGTQLQLIPGGPTSAPHSASVVSLDPADRACRLYQLRRSTLIYQTRTRFGL